MSTGAVNPVQPRSVFPATTTTTGSLAKEVRFRVRRVHRLSSVVRVVIVVFNSPSRRRNHRLHFRSAHQPFDNSVNLSS